MKGVSLICSVALQPTMWISDFPVYPPAAPRRWKRGCAVCVGFALKTAEPLLRCTAHCCMSPTASWSAATPAVHASLQVPQSANLVAIPCTLLLQHPDQHPVSVCNLPHLSLHPVFACLKCGELWVGITKGMVEQGERGEAGVRVCLSL